MPIVTASVLPDTPSLAITELTWNLTVCSESTRLAGVCNIKDWIQLWSRLCGESGDSTLVPRPLAPPAGAAKRCLPTQSHSKLLSRRVKPRQLAIPLTGVRTNDENLALTELEVRFIAIAEKNRNFRTKPLFGYAQRTGDFNSTTLGRKPACGFGARWTVRDKSKILRLTFIKIIATTMLDAVPGVKQTSHHRVGALFFPHPAV
jgi:hypothetical protein